MCLCCTKYIVVCIALFLDIVIITWKYNKSKLYFSTNIGVLVVEIVYILSINDSHVYSSVKNHTWVKT
jgi:hypothetical protein